MMRLSNDTTKTALSSRLRIARTAWERLVGFLAHREIASDEAIWFDRCASVHTIGMRATIDIIFLDADRRIVAMERNVQSNRTSVSHRGAKSVLEIGRSDDVRMRVGDVLGFDPTVTSR